MLAISVILLGIGQVLMGVAIFGLLARVKVLETKLDVHVEIFERQAEINKNLMKHCAELNYKIDKINSNKE